MLEGEGLDEFKRFAQDMENPEYIVIGDNRSKFDFEYLSRALRVLLKGARLIGMQPELIDKSIGETTLNVGAWVGMLERASGAQATYVGKPSPFVFELTLRTMGLDKSQVIMVGDQVATDIKGAKDFGIRSALLRTGEFRAGELDGSLKPDYEFGSIRDVLTIL
jgi:HAD superfamily hydrolase (TIGR01450 family)